MDRIRSQFKRILRAQHTLALMLGLSLLLHGFAYLANSDLQFWQSSSHQRLFTIDLKTQNLEDLKKRILAKNPKATHFSSPTNPNVLIKKQIVNNEQSGEELRPLNSRFLGEKDQFYKQQTVAKHNGIFNKAGLGQEQAQVQDQIPTAVQKQLQQSATRPTKPLALTDLNIGNELVYFKKRQEEEKQLEKMVEGATSQVRDPKAIFRGKKGQLSGDPDEMGLALNNDFIEDVPLGDMTNLNTVEYKFFGFYSRIRKKLEIYWGDSLRKRAEDIYRSGRRLEGGKNYITSLKITLDERGNIQSVSILSQSGSLELDKAAIESFQKAGPFPNPPKELVSEGKAVIEWGFVVKS